MTDIVCDCGEADRVGNANLGTEQAQPEHSLTRDRRETEVVGEIEIDLLEAWMKDYGNAVWSFIFTILNNHALTDDVSQEVFIRAYTHMKSFRQDSSVKTWLFSIARNLCHDTQSSWAVRRVSATDRMDLIMDSRRKRAVAMGCNANSRESPVEANVILNWQMNQAWQHILGLRPGYREVVLLRLREELSFLEIAQVMKISESTARVRYHRAMDKLRKVLAKEGVGQ